MCILRYAKKFSKARGAGTTVGWVALLRHTSSCVELTGGSDGATRAEGCAVIVWYVYSLDSFPNHRYIWQRHLLALAAWQQ